MKTKRSTTQKTYRGLIRYRLDGTWLGHPIPTWIPCSLRVSDEYGETKIEFLTEEQAATDIASDEYETFLSQGRRYAYWHAYWTQRTNQESDSPWLESWVQDLAAQLAPILPELLAKLYVFYLLTTLVKPLQDDPSVIQIGPLSLPCSLDATGMYTVVVPLDDPALTPLVDSTEASFIELLTKNEKYRFPQHSFALGLTVWRDYAVITTCEIEIASGQDAVTAMSPDELLVAIEDYAIEDYSFDPDRYNDIIIRLVSGHMHRLVEEVMLEWMDVLGRVDELFND